MEGEPIWVSTLSSHCRGPFRCSSIQQGVLVTVCRLQSRVMESWGDRVRERKEERKKVKGREERDGVD